MTSDKVVQAPSVPRVELCRNIATYNAWRNGLALASGAAMPVIGFVPTMGALHEGHMTLIERARAECDKVVVSIFVNPLQFAPHEDFDKYPRPFERDLAMCEAAGVDAIFSPMVEEIYGSSSRDHVTKVVPPEELTATMEGAFRPGFFTGVATVVCKLFNIIRADRAYFGEKDYQQLQVVQRMVVDLNLPVTIEPVATVRESDGLAMSSRNVYLSQEQRSLAPVLNKVLCQVRDEILSRKPVAEALERGRSQLSQTAGIELQYLEACHAKTLVALTEPQKPFVVLVAAKLGDVRLIDNVVVNE